MDLIRLLKKCARQFIHVSSGACMLRKIEEFSTFVITAAPSVTIVKPRINVCNAVSYLSSNASLILLRMFAALGWSGPSIGNNVVARMLKRTFSNGPLSLISVNEQ